MKTKVRYIEVIVFWFPIIFLTGMLSFNALHYYDFNPEYGILSENKEAFTNILWTISLYIHVGAGVVCLIIPLILFIGQHFNLPIKWHRNLGKVYVVDVLCVVFPTGMYLALFAKGGVITQIGFLCQGALLALCTWFAFYQVRSGNIFSHKQWMIRSYAFASSVLTFRVLHILFYQLEIPYEINYPLSQWMCLTINAIVAESIISYQNNLKLNLEYKQL